MRLADERKAALNEFNGMYPMEIVEQFLEEATREWFDFLLVNLLAPPREEAFFKIFEYRLLPWFCAVYNKCIEPVVALVGFSRNAAMQAMRVGMGVDNFFKSNGHRLRNIAAVVAPYIAAESPALAAGVAAAGQAASSYSTLRDQLDRAAA